MVAGFMIISVALGAGLGIAVFGLIGSMIGGWILGVIGSVIGLLLGGMIGALVGIFALWWTGSDQ
jgi:hypothetical protein